MTLLFATTNLHKLKECQKILAPFQITIKSCQKPLEIKETAPSFFENALIKARYTSTIFNNTPTFADDSGLVVPALQGAPGIFSARYAGSPTNDKKNIQKLLEAMRLFNGEKRHAFFYCAIAMITHPEDPTPLLVSGRIDGIITKTPIGQNGFGYDPVFYLPDYDCTMAELTANLKNKISHRAKAVTALGKQLLL